MKIFGSKSGCWIKTYVYLSSKNASFSFILMILLSSVSILGSAVALSALLKNLQIFSENEKILPNYKMATLGTKNVHSALMTIISNRRNWDVYWKIAPLIMLFDPSDLWFMLQ